MKVQLLSDLHLEFKLREYDFSACDVLILAGDTNLGVKGVEWILEKAPDKPVIYLFGNHEYYNHLYPDTLYKAIEMTQGSNVHVLENDSIIIGDVTFHGATLWTDFALYGHQEVAQIECQRWMNDYNYIKIAPSYSKLRSSDTQKMHIESRKWLENSVKSSSTSKNIVVTHHAPSLRSVPDIFEKDIITAAFASNMDNFIEEIQPDYWFHGHTHGCANYFIGNTNVICNPYGYPHEDIPNFNEQLIIEI